MIQVTIEGLFHACDIGNSAYDFDHYIPWASLVSIEFSQQAGREEELGLEITTGFHFGGLQSLFRDQAWFIGNIVQPLWKELSLSWPGLTKLVESIERNRELSLIHI